MNSKLDEVKRLINENKKIANNMRNEREEILSNCAAILTHQGKTNGVIINESLAITIIKDIAEFKINFPFGNAPGEMLLNLDLETLLELKRRFALPGSEE